MADAAELGIIMRGYDEASGPMDQVEGRAGGLITTLGRFGLAAMGVKALTTSIAGLAQGMVSGNAEFERYETQFGVLLGGAEAAKQRLSELAEFGAKTPFELPEVVRADKVLQSFGLHSEEAAKKFGYSGVAIRTIIGDVASGAGAGFEEITNLVGRFASGATGEAIMRFQELGITTRDEMRQMGLEFSNAGQLMSPVPEAMSTVLKIMQKKYGGMMEAQSKTFEGMMSNLNDWIGQTKRKIMAPIFDVLKGQLAGLLTLLGSPATAKAIDMLANGMAKGVGFAATQIAALARSIMRVKDPLVSFGKYIAVVVQEGDHMNDFLSDLPGPLRTVATVIGGATSTVRSIVLSLKDWYTGSDALEEHLQGLPTPLRNLTDGMGHLVRAASDIIAIALPLSKMIGETLVRDFKTMGDILSPLVSVLLPPLLSAFETITGYIQKAAGNLVFWNVGVAETTTTTANFATTLARVLELWLGILAAKKVVSFTQDIIHTGQTFIQGIKDAIQTITQVFKRDGSKSIQEKWVEMGEGWGKDNVTQTITQKVAVDTKFDGKALATGLIKSIATGIAGAAAALFATSGVASGILGGIGAALAAIPGVGWIILGVLVVGAILTAIAIKFKDQISRLAGVIGGWLKDAFIMAVQALPGIIGNVLGAVSGALVFAFLILPALIIDTIISGLISGVPKLIGGIWTVLQVIGGAFAALPGIVSPVLSALPSLLLDVVMSIPGIVAQIPGFFLSLPGWIGDAIASIPGIIRDIFVGGYDFATGILHDLYTFIMDTPLGDAAKWIMGKVLGGFEEGWNFVDELTGGRLTGLVDRVTSSFTTLKDTLGNIWGSIKTFAKESWQGVVDIIKGSVNSIINAINDFIRGLNGIDISFPGAKIPFAPDIPGFNIGLPDIPEIPTLGRGGIAVRPTLAVLAEKPGMREAILPLPAGGMRGMGGPVINGAVNININGVNKSPLQNAQEVRRELLRMKSGGVNLWND